MRLVVGLGNPGPRYADTPHNVGFRVLDRFAERHAGGHPAGATCMAWSARFDAEVAMAALGSERLVLLKPQTYMNRSGESVREAMSFFKIEPSSTLVVHDELDLPLGSVKLKLGGGEAGHNGLKSVTAELGTREYVRLRVGVGRPPAGEVSDYLLSPLPGDRAGELEAHLDEASAAIDLWTVNGLERAMNLVNRKPAPTKPGRQEAGQPD